MTERVGDRVRLAGFVLALLLAVVSAIGWAVTAGGGVAENRDRIKDHECRIRAVETVMPRIDEKLANIERIVREESKKQ